MQEPCFCAVVVVYVLQQAGTLSPDDGRVFAVSADSKRMLALFAGMLIAASAATAGTLTVEGTTGLAVAIASETPITMEDSVPALRGQVTIAPAADTLRDHPLMLFVDHAARAMTHGAGGEFGLNTAEMPDGDHTLRVDAVRGEYLIASTGSIAVKVLNSVAPAAVQQAEIVVEEPPLLGGPRPPFNKLYKPKIFHEIVYFNNREADLEKHAFIRKGRVYITLTDLMRHIGGSIIWGPCDQQVVVFRNGIAVKVFPNKATVCVSQDPANFAIAQQALRDDRFVGFKMSLGVKTVRKQNRLYVPVRPFCAIFGVVTDWDLKTDRAYVTYQG